nr:integrase, catalytic core [Tanacetum cinerariifolium]
MAQNESEQGEWIFDSGCTEYITHLSNALTNNKDTPFENPVIIPNGDSIPVKGKGECILPGGKKINGVLYILDFKCNLLSVNRLSYVINRLPSKVIKNKTPFKLILNKEPDYGSLKVFGCLVYFKNTDTKGDKFDERGKPGVFLGYPPGTKGYKVFDLETKRIVLNRDVNFHEEIFLFDKVQERGENETGEPMLHHECHYFDKHDLMQSKWENIVNENVQVHDNQNGGPGVPHEVNEQQMGHLNDEEQEINEPDQGQPNQAQSEADEPKSFKQAAQSDNWREAMKNEIKPMERNGTWTLEVLPKGKRAIDSKWVYKI